MNGIREAIQKVVQSENLTSTEAELAMTDILSGEATQAQIGAFLAALRVKGESADEILGCARAMRQHAKAVLPLRAGHCIDTCGTGGDMAGTFNISTAAAFVVAGAGIPVAKHGNRSISSSCGSADVLEKLGVSLALDADQVARCIDEVGIGFIFAPRFHPAMANAMGPRRELAVRTVFNILGPLSNPASVPYQVIGVYDAALLEPLAHVLAGLGLKRALLVHGHSALDELSTTGPNLVAEMTNGQAHSYVLDPTDLGFPEATLDDLHGGDAQINAEIVRSVLSGTKGRKREVVVLNAAAAMYAAEAAPSIQGAVTVAERSIDSGSALATLENLVSLSQHLATEVAA